MASLLNDRGNTKIQAEDRQMADYRNFDANKRPTVAAPRPSEAARLTAAAVVREISGNLDHNVIDELTLAALDRDPANAKRTIHHVMAAGVRAEDLADFYIPTIARDLGDQWCEDGMSFASVTIGVSRLQMMLRELGANWSGNMAENDNTDTILLVIPKDIYHTLGAVVLSGQLRRKGLSVKLLLGGDPKDVAQRVESTKYSAVFISSSRGEALESLRLIVDAIKTSVSKRPPIVVGGTILEVETAEDVMALTGADHATKIPDEALRLCGLLQSTHNGAPHKARN
jgi:methanogenic corrinoid protein MtbC1